MKTGTIAAIVLLELVAVAHLLRIVLGWPMTIADWNVPVWISILGVIVPSGIAFLLLHEARAGRD